MSQHLDPRHRTPSTTGTPPRRNRRRARQPASSVETLRVSRSVTPHRSSCAGARVLIVDADPGLRSSLTKELCASGLHCEAVDSGERALERLRASDVDLVLLEVELPGSIQGWQVLEHLRATGQGPSVIWVTTRGAIAERVRGLRMGADDYVSKPFAMAELQARIDAVLRRRAETVTRVGDLVIDTRRPRVARAGRVLDVTVTELAFLLRLSEEAGEPVSRRSLLESVWGIVFDPGTNMVDVLVRRLRKKIDAPFDAPLIRTVRGKGYALSARTD